MISNFLKWYNKKFIKSPIVVLIITLCLIIAGIGSVTSGMREIKDWYLLIQTSVFEDKYEAEYKKISQLNTGLTVKYIDNIFGTPKVRREYDTKQKYTESFYDCKGYLLNTISSKEDKILVYSITITKPEFYAPVPLNFGDEVIDGETRKFFIGKMKLDDLGEIPIKICSEISSKFAYYSEIYYFGNAGSYKEYLFGYSPLGCELDDNDKYSELFSTCANLNIKENNELVKNEEVLKLRKGYAPNSFGVIDEEYEYSNFNMGNIGFDYLSGRNLIDNN
ncbi:MAG TPA: hypothetical protein DEP72_02325 [Clostridiales bacterium]|nr:MAG: hypothetical protein A2Y18_01260 [Clostridiales bacterium GWD2_32_19]HCC06992.1 hypothetical protein [Clostridiales bacterium]